MNAIKIFLNTEYSQNLFSPIYTSIDKQSLQDDLTYSSHPSIKATYTAKIEYSKKNQFKLIAISLAYQMLVTIEKIAKALIHFIGSSFSKDCTIEKGRVCLKESIKRLFYFITTAVSLPLDLIFTCFEKGPYSPSIYKRTIQCSN
jgi:hypothetical protein